MFGHESLPARIFSYGANAPIGNWPLVEDQMRRSHEYKNKIIEVERARRTASDAALAELCPELLKIEAEILNVEDRIEALDSNMAVDRMAFFSKEYADADKNKALVGLKKQQKELFAKRKALRDPLFQSSSWKKKAEPIEHAAKKAGLENRANSAIYWGNYLHVEQSMRRVRKGAPPKFARWDGDGHLAVQIQNGMTVEEALSGADSRIRIKEGRVEVEGSRTAKTGIMRKLGNALCSFRVGSDPKGKPIFAEVPFTMHRPLPPDAMIKWVHLIRRKIGTHFEWRLQFVVSKKKWVKGDQATDGTVGVSMGWRKNNDGSLCVATYSGSDGVEDVLTLPFAFLCGMEKIRDMQVYRDKFLTEHCRMLAEWLKDYGEQTWLHEATPHLSQWRSAAKLASVVLKWRINRLPGDENIFMVLEAWRQRDKHLYDYQSNSRDQLLRQREDLYRNFAADMRRRYKTLKIRAMNYSAMQQRPAKDADPTMKLAYENARNVCLSSLERFLKESTAKTVEFENKNLLNKCSTCGAAQKMDYTLVVHTCTECGDSYERSVNSARNLLGLSSAAMA